MTEREIHLEERPIAYKQVVGQATACKQLIAMGKSKTIPHCILFTGPSGCGKTTLARITRTKLGCSDVDFYELNCAQTRGIDMVRRIQTQVGLCPMGGQSRVWLIDECHQLTPDAQGAFLKLLEEPPDHAYFMLATTNPEKLKTTIKTRCTEIKVRTLHENEIVALVSHIHSERCENGLASDVAAKLAEVADGSARKALVLLQQIIGVEGDSEKLEVLQKTTAKEAGIAIARGLMNGMSWRVMAELLKNCDEEPESLRWMILSYFSTVALSGNAQKTEKAIRILEEFQDNYYDSKRAGLILSCYRALQ